MECIISSGEIYLVCILQRTEGRIRIAIEKRQTQKRGMYILMALSINHMLMISALDVGNWGSRQ